MTQLLFKTVFGSHLYGTNTPTSDTDYKSVHIPDAKSIIMGRTPGVISRSTNETSEKNTVDDIDDESFSVRKLLSMLRDGDMIAYELLFIDPENKNVEIFDEVWYQKFYFNRSALIDRNILGFVGYIRKQANKYGIKGSRIATAKNALEMFDSLCTIHGFSAKLNVVPNEIFDRFVESNEHCSLIQLPVKKDSEELSPYIEILNRKIGYTVSLGEARKIVSNIYNEYGARAQAALLNEGVDWKSLYHAIRVSEQAIELLETKKITFPRQNVDDLLKIKRGEYVYTDIADRLEENLQRLEQLMITSTLPKKYNERYMEAVEESLYVAQVLDEYSH